MATRAPGPVPAGLALAPMNKTDPTMQKQLGSDLDHLRQTYHEPSYGRNANDTYTGYVANGMDADMAQTLPQ